MTTERLSTRISNALEKHRAEVSERQKILDGKMGELLAQREAFAAMARRIIQSLIHPRLEELASHFDNASIIEGHGDTDFHCVCKFSHVPRFPATVSLDFSLMPGDDPSQVTIHCGVEILPVLMEYKKNDDLSVALNSDEKISLWLEDRIIEFIDIYLRLETDVLYQKDNLVTDPVCGMRISLIEATSTVEWQNRTIYFCSDLCKDTFLKQQR